MIDRRIRRLVLAALASASLGAACSDGASAGVEPTRYVAVLTASGARPTPTRSPATGTASFTMAGSGVDYTVTASGFATTLTVGHIHIGGSETTGPVIVALALSGQSGLVTSGTLNLAQTFVYNTVTISGDSLRALFANGHAYVDLHSAAFPGGEIRGQIVRQ